MVVRLTAHARLAVAVAVGWTVVGQVPFLPHESARASPQEVIGFGYRSIGMGNTGVAIGSGVDSVYANPALLSASHDLSLSLGIMGASFALSAEGPGSTSELVPYSALRANTIGGILPLPFGGVLTDRVTIGLGFMTPFDVVVRGRILYPEKAQYLLADRTQSVAVQAALGVDIGYGIRLGGGFAALAALDGSVTVGTDASGRIGTTVEDTLVASYAPIVGAAFDIDERYRVGLTFRGELVGRFNVVIRANDLGQLQIPPLNISGVAQYDPWQIAAEFARVSGDFRVAIGLTYKHWPAYPGPIEPTVRCEDAEPDTDCDVLSPRDPAFTAVVSPRAGVERAWSVQDGATLLARAGYAFEPSPAPEQTGATNYFDNHKSVFSVGYGVELADPLPPIGFDGFAQLQWLHARSHEKRIADGAARDGMVDTSGLILALGTSGTVRF
jgi:long-chain fatty acid transport protein